MGKGGFVLPFLFCFFCLFSFSFALDWNFDPEVGGFDIVVRGDALQEVQDLINPIIVEEIQNSALQAPDVDGSHYVATNFQVPSLVFSSAQLNSINNGVEYKVSITNFRFEYEIDVSFLGDCTWNIVFYNNQEIPLTIPVILDLSQENPTFSCDPSWDVLPHMGFTFKQTCVGFLCSADPICIGSGGDVQDGATKSFYVGMRAIPVALGIAVSQEVKRHFSSASLLPHITLPWRSTYSVGIDFRGLLTAQNTAPPSGLIQSPTVFTHGGFFLSPPGNADPSLFVSPPFIPTVTPDMLTAPPNQLSFFLTDYFFHSFVWSVESSGTMDGPILPNMVPESSPFQLNTGNAIMRTIAPGLRGNNPMLCQVDISSYANYSLLEISSSGIQSSNNTILTSYYEYNTTTLTREDLLFSLSQKLTFTVDVSLDDSLPELRLDIAISHLKISGTTTTESNVGRINTLAATTYMNSGLKFLQHTKLSEPFVLPLPISSESFTSTPTLATSDGYLYGGGDFLPEFHPKYISELVVVSAKEAVDAVCPEDYDRIQQFYDSDGDFNQQGGGYTIYLCVKYDKTPGAQMLTNLSMVGEKHESNAVCPHGFTRIPEGVSSDGDFNQKAGGFYIYLCAQYSVIPGDAEENHGAVGGVGHVGVVAHHSKVSSPCDRTSGYAPTMVPYNIDSDGDYNQKAGGHWIYLCYNG